MLQPISLKKIRVANPWTEAAALSLLRFGPDDVAEASWIGLNLKVLGGGDGWSREFSTWTDHLPETSEIISANIRLH